MDYSKITRVLQLFEIKDNIDKVTTITPIDGILKVSITVENSELPNENLKTLNIQVSELISKKINP